MGQCMKNPKKIDGNDQGMLEEAQSEMNPPLEFPQQSNQIGHIPQLPQYKMKVISDVQESQLLQYRAKRISDVQELSGIEKDTEDHMEPGQEMSSKVKPKNMGVSQPIQIISRCPAKSQIKGSHLQGNPKSIPSKICSSSEVSQNVPIYEQAIPQASQSAEIISRETSLFKSDNPKARSSQQSRGRDGLLKSSIEFNGVRETIDARRNEAQESSLKTNANNIRDTHLPSFSQVASKVASCDKVDENKKVYSTISVDKGPNEPRTNQQGCKMPQSQINSRSNHNEALKLLSPPFQQLTK